MYKPTIEYFNNCPSMSEISEYISGQNDNYAYVVEHVMVCSKCSSLLEKISNGNICQLDKSKIKSKKELDDLNNQEYARTNNSIIKSGQIWSTKSRYELPYSKKLVETDDPAVVIIFGKVEPSMNKDEYYVAPISVDLEYASEMDLFVKGKDSPLGYDFMVEVWNIKPTLQQSFDHYLGEISKLTFQYLENIYLKATDAINDIGVAKSYVGNGKIEECNDIYYFREFESKKAEYLALSYEERAIEYLHLFNGESIDLFNKYQISLEKVLKILNEEYDKRRSPNILHSHWLVIINKLVQIELPEIDLVNIINQLKLILMRKSTVGDRDPNIMLKAARKKYVRKT